MSWSPSHLRAVANNVPTGICNVDHSLGGGEGRRAGVEGVVAVAQHLIIVLGDYHSSYYRLLTCLFFIS